MSNLNSKLHKLIQASDLNQLVKNPDGGKAAHKELVKLGVIHENGEWRDDVSDEIKAVQEMYS